MDKTLYYYSDQKHPKDLNALDVERFLTHLAVNKNVAAGTQSLALNSIAFLYNTYLDMAIGDFAEFRRAKRQAKLPTVLTQEEIVLLLSNLDTKYKLIVGLLYGSGLRRLELFGFG